MRELEEKANGGQSSDEEDKNLALDTLKGTRMINGIRTDQIPK